ncbi:hypothetical protein MBLNU459_g0526t1 [Dothideomycetes sp. NU459]
MQLLDLPPEIRTHIYSYIFHPSANCLDLGEGYESYHFSKALQLFLVNKQVYYESRKVFYDLNTFVRIATPWKDAKHHVSVEGYVYIIVAGAAAAKFNKHSLSVTVDAPRHNLHNDLDQFIILVDDLDKFCRSWFYSSLSMPSLNSHLTLSLNLRDPFTPADEDKHVTKFKQRRLFEPFGQVKDLQRVVISGEPEPFQSVIKEMRGTMAIPFDSPEKCLQEATRLKDEGNVHLQASRYTEALESYRLAWLAMHIIIKGRTRHVHGDQWFDRRLEEEPFAGQHGGTVRVILRIRLVANTVLTYLKLEQYDMAILTGMRTIKVMRSSIGLSEDEAASDPSQEALTQFAAAPEMGKIYYRTALAWKATGDKSEARALLKVAMVYLPNDRIVQKEMAACALAIG